MHGLPRKPSTRTCPCLRSSLDVDRRNPAGTTPWQQTDGRGLAYIHRVLQSHTGTRPLAVRLLKARRADESIHAHRCQRCAAGRRTQRLFSLRAPGLIPGGWKNRPGRTAFITVFCRSAEPFRVLSSFDGSVLIYVLASRFEAPSRTSLPGDIN